MGRRSSKEALLDAAERVIKRQGMASTTIEAVAAEAGLSKGGLFYHFSSKKDMLLQLLERFERQFYAQRQEIYDSLPEGPHRLLKATVIASVRIPAKRETSISNVLALLDDVELRELVRKMKLRTLREITEKFPKPEKALMALLVVDGLWVMDMFAENAISYEMEKSIIDQLLELIDIYGGEPGETDAAQPPLPQ